MLHNIFVRKRLQSIFIKIQEIYVKKTPSKTTQNKTPPSQKKYNNKMK